LGADLYGIVFDKGEIVCREGDPGDTMGGKPVAV